MSGNGAYPLHLARPAIRQIRMLLNRADRAGVLDRVKAALATIQNRLRVNPTEWGDPSHDLRSAGMTIYQRIHDELSVTYGVHEDRHQVWLFRVVPVLAHPARSGASDEE